MEGAEHTVGKNRDSGVRWPIEQSCPHPLVSFVDLGQGARPLRASVYSFVK